MVEQNIETLGIVTNGVQEGTNLFTKVDIEDSSAIVPLFNRYNQIKQAISNLQDEAKEIQPVLKGLVKAEGGEFIHDGMKAQISPARVDVALKTKAEVLVAVPKKYHYLILKDKPVSEYLKVGVAPKKKEVTVTITE